jgi:glycosyltransferase involved in cell wall biosynthesis
MNNPLVSVIIPTFRRPELLPIAVQSALEHAGDDVEAIVVPNGSDQSYRQSLAEFTADDRVRVEPVSTAHGNVARNHGLALARGKYVRFLDDDDYLLPGARDQLELLSTSNADVCSGRLTIVDQDGLDHGLAGFPSTTDFVCAAVTFSGFSLPTGTLFLRSCLDGNYWDANIDRNQDYIWMIDLAAQREWQWVHLDMPVGVWFQHDKLRTSSVAAMTGKEEAVISRLMKLNERLTKLGSGNPERDAAIAAALWRYAHQGFPYHPFYWRRIARKAVEISPGSRPNIRAYQYTWLRWAPPIGAECLLAPARRLTRLYRDLRGDFHGHDYRRRL